MKPPLFLLLIFMISCTTEQQDTAIATKDTKSTANSILTDKSSASTEIIETFTDSLNIGEKSKCKIELIKHRVFEDAYVIVKFYTKGLKHWEIKNTYFYECNALMDFQPDISDFNNDKFNDITFISATAARGSNEVRRLFIYDSKEKKLISIVNSESYPNMLYNKELDCIDAFMVHGGSTTVFLRIKGDSLKTFAWVDNSDYRNVYEIDKFGKKKLIRKDTITNEEDYYTRYINYKPLKEKVYKN